MKRVALLLLLFVLLAGSLSAQQPAVVFRGRGDPLLDARLKRALREPGRKVWVRDTLVARGDTVREPLLLAGNTVKLEGVLLGDVISVGADVFVRPSAQVRGDVLSLAGGWYPSSLAVVGGSVTSDPNAPYEVFTEPDRVRIVGTTHSRLVTFRPRVPTYDRVDGLSLGVGATLLLPPLGSIEPAIDGWGTYRSERGEVDGGAQASIARKGLTLSGGAERATLTNEYWIRDDITNSVNYLVLGKDSRDYYQSDRAWVELRQRLGTDAHGMQLWARGQVEDATSLRADHPWTLLKPDSVRSNLPVNPGRISSLMLGADVKREGEATVTKLSASVENALDAYDADVTFMRYLLDLDFAMLAIRDHTLEIEAHLQGPIIDDPCMDCDGPPVLIPRQRWSFVGGSGTLHTFRLAEFRGDRVVFVETKYGIPLGARFRLPMLGIPTLDLLHITGMAWTRGQDHGLEQNVGFRLRYNVAYVRVVTDPEHFRDHLKFTVGVSFPKRGYPWQQGSFF